MNFPHISYTISSILRLLGFMIWADKSDLVLIMGHCDLNFMIQISDFTQYLKHYFMNLHYCLVNGSGLTL